MICKYCDQEITDKTFDKHITKKGEWAAHWSCTNVIRNPHKPIASKLDDKGVCHSYHVKCDDCGRLAMGYYQGHVCLLCYYKRLDAEASQNENNHIARL
jgi:hypothetical protein